MSEEDQQDKSKQVKADIASLARGDNLALVESQLLREGPEVIRDKAKIGSTLRKSGLDLYTAGNISLQIEVLQRNQMRYEEILQRHDKARDGEGPSDDEQSPETVIFIINEIARLALVIEKYIGRSTELLKVMGTAGNIGKKKQKSIYSHAPGEVVGGDVTYDHG